MNDRVDQLLAEWSAERPDLDNAALGVVVRVQLLAKLFSEAAERALQDSGLKHWEYDVLSALRRQGPPYEMLALELADASLLTSGTMTTRIDGLEQRGLVERRPNPRDRRTINVRLTSAGKRLVDRAVEARLAVAHDDLQCLTEQERHELSTPLRKIMLKLAGP